MNTCFSGLLRSAVMGGALFLAASYAPSSNAADGCGFGYHLSFHGGCILNYPGPMARPAPMHPGCWRNAFGALRCYR